MQLRRYAALAFWAQARRIRLESEQGTSGGSLPELVDPFIDPAAAAAPEEGVLPEAVIREAA